jgi:hypothetical protein
MEIAAAMTGGPGGGATAPEPELQPDVLTAIHQSAARAKPRRADKLFNIQQSLVPSGELCAIFPTRRVILPYDRRITGDLSYLDNPGQFFVHRATPLANAGPTSSTRMNRAICMAITNGTSTLEEAAMIATESAPPGLVAR